MSPQRPFDALLADARTSVLEAAFLTGGFNQAEALMEDARQVAESAGIEAQAAVLDQLGFLQHWKNLEVDAQRDVDRELALFERALLLRQQIRDEAGIAESLFHVGLVHQLFKRDWETAQPYFEQARSLAEKVGDQLLLSEAHRHIGAYYWLHKGDFDTALSHLRKSLELRENLDFRVWPATGLITLGQCELAAGHTSAMEHLREGVRIAEEAGMRDRWLRSAREALE